MKSRHQRLQVWQEAFDLAITVYGSLEPIKEAKDFGLLNQIRRSSVSVFSNIAEGSESGSDAKFRNYIHISLASLAELQSQLQFAQAVYGLSESQLEDCFSRSSVIRAKLKSLKNYLEKGSK